MSERSKNELWYGFNDEIDLIISKISCCDKNRDCNRIVADYLMEGIGINYVDYNELTKEGYHYYLSRYHVAEVFPDKIVNISPQYHGMLFVQN